MSIEQMQGPQIRGSVDGSDAYGFGLAIKSICGDTKVFHYGGTPGFWNCLQHFQKSDRMIIVLTNNESEKGLTNAVAAILFDQKVTFPSKHRETKLDPEQLKKFVGTYELNGNFAFSIELKDGKLYRLIKNEVLQELKPESKTKLFYADGTDRQIKIIFGRQQSVKKVFFIADGIDLELIKNK